jgi:hypothetical protein
MLYIQGYAATIFTVQTGVDHSRGRVNERLAFFQFSPFQNIVQGCDQLQQLVWIMFATGSFTKLQPALVLEVRHVSSSSMSSPRLQLPA